MNICILVPFLFSAKCGNPETTRFFLQFATVNVVVRNLTARFTLTSQLVLILLHNAPKLTMTSLIMSDVTNYDVTNYDVTNYDVTNYE